MAYQSICNYYQTPYALEFIPICYLPLVALHRALERKFKSECSFSLDKKG